MSQTVCTIGNSFNDLEGIRLAIEIEGRGKAFYQQAYNQATKDGHKELFLLLKNEELHHLERFTKTYNELKKQISASAEKHDYSADSTRYIKALASTHVFPAEELAAEKIAELKTMDAILRTALQAEKDSVLLYDELSQCAKSDDAKQIFFNLKAEEQYHVVKIKEMLDGWA